MTRDWSTLLAMIPSYDPERGAAGFRFDPDLAGRACDFIEGQLRLIEGKHAGQQFDLLDWQRAFIGCLFGWVDDAGARRYREALLYIPRKNGKSPLCAAILDYVLLCDGEAGAQCYCAAVDRDQAGIVFRHARGMIERNRWLKSKVTIYETNRSIRFGDSFARVISADAASKHGYNSHLVIVDELHAQPSRELVDVLITSTSTRRQPLVLFLTTADYDRPSICNERHDYACKVRDGLVDDPRFLPMIYEAERADDWQDEAVWRKSNPSLGVTKTVEYMRRECERAKNEPSYQATFRRLELNQQTDVATVWLPMDKWDSCGESVSDADLEQLPCWGGLDLSSTGDLTALAFAWPLGDGRVAVRAWHWIPAEGAREREKVDRVPYKVWAEAGLVEATPGNVIDYAHVRAKVNEIAKRFQVKAIGADPWNATQIIIELKEQDGLTVEPFRQGWQSMSPACKELERLVLSGKLCHGGSAILRWQAGHAIVKSDPAGNIKLDKTIPRNRIDGLVAVTIAVKMAADGQAANKRGVYEGRELRFI
jgi:phage terminase large subunit-like protein